jgi:RimJ/RimL family protein N-acetyltransferase
MRTDRLLLRRWREEDREPFATINADPAVMEHFPSTLTAGQSDAMIDRIEASFAEHGFGLWVVELAPPASFSVTRACRPARGMRI